MLTIGCHLSKRRGYLEIAKEAASINANTFQYFTRSPRGSEQAALDEKDVAAYLAFAKEHGIHDALAYAPYDADPATDKRIWRAWLRWTARCTSSARAAV